MSNTGRLIIKTVSRPIKEGEGDLLEWFCDVFGLAGRNSRFEPEILKEIVGSSIKGEGVTSKDLNKRLERPRSTVIYHLNRFIYSGLVVRKGRKYYLRSMDMENTIKELQSEMLIEFNRIMEFAERLDRIMEEDLHDERQRKGKRGKER